MVKYEKIDVIKLAELQCKASDIDLIDYTDEEREKGCKLLERYIQEIKVDIPSLIPVLNLFTLFPVKLPIDISTDYVRLFFNPKLIIQNQYSLQERTIKEQLMHIIIHGLLGDNELAISEKKSKVLWLALDQRANDICFKLGFTPGDSVVADRMKFMKENKPYSLSFGNYYLSKNNKYLKKKAPAAWKSIACDNHEFWYQPYVKKILGITNYIDEGQDEDADGGSKKWNKVRKIFMEDEGNTEGDEENKNTKSIENSITRKIDSDLRNKKRGVGTGSSKEIIEAAEGKPIDYKEIIREILHQLEDPREVPDSIDPMMYQFGLDTYGDVPLIEPREGDEILKLNTICVAIDTSGSCSGSTAQLFLREIRELIRELKGSIGSGRLMLIQCDYDIQKEDIYEIDEFLDEDSREIAEFKGWGGTSFVPVFKRLEKVLNEDDAQVDALIYLSDGYGDFPDEVPEYPTIFVVPKEDADGNGWIPKWVQVGIID